MDDQALQAAADKKRWKNTGLMIIYMQLRRYGGNSHAELQYSMPFGGDI